MTGVINGTPLAEFVQGHIHARTQFTRVYCVDLLPPGQVPENDIECKQIEKNFLDFVDSNNFIKGVLAEHGLVHSFGDNIREAFKRWKITDEIDYSPVTVPNTIFVFGLHIELCVVDHVEELKRQFPKTQIMILSDLCFPKHDDWETFIFNYCLRTKHADYIRTAELVIHNED